MLTCDFKSHCILLDMTEAWQLCLWLKLGNFGDDWSLATLAMTEACNFGYDWSLAANTAALGRINESFCGQGNKTALLLNI